jgi:hypothetical protein
MILEVYFKFTKYTKAWKTLLNDGYQIINDRGSFGITASLSALKYLPFQSILLSITHCYTHNQNLALRAAPTLPLRIATMHQNAPKAIPPR